MAGRAGQEAAAVGRDAGHVRSDGGLHQAARGLHGQRGLDRIGEPAANPYLYFASQVHAGLDGIARGLKAPPATDAPYAGAGESLPTSLGDALAALQADATLCDAFGRDFIAYFTRIKQSEQQRFEAAEDPDEFQRREYFARF